MKKCSRIRFRTITIVLLLATSCDTPTSPEDDSQETRADVSTRITYSTGNASCQNPAFSPDNERILFTRFLNGYNSGPSELVEITISSLAERVVISANEADNVNVPGPVWIDGQICWASDRSGEIDEIFIANDDGSGIEQITEHPESEGYYLEPVFNPSNTDRIVFEYGPSDYVPHHIAVVEMDYAYRVTLLTDDSGYDDRLPNWSFDGNNMILFQRADAGDDHWQIYTGTIVFMDSIPVLQDVTRIAQPNAHNTDNSWYINNQYILSSSDYNIAIPNIYAFPVDGGTPVRVSASSDHEDGAASCSPDGKWIAFESHRGQDEDTPSEIWIIETPGTLRNFEQPDRLEPRP